jgi:hypothetical protein
VQFCESRQYMVECDLLIFSSWYCDQDIACILDKICVWICSIFVFWFMLHVESFVARFGNGSVSSQHLVASIGTTNFLLLGMEI